MSPLYCWDYLYDYCVEVVRMRISPADKVAISSPGNLLLTYFLIRIMSSA